MLKRIQRQTTNLVLLNQSTTLLVHVDTTMLAVVNTIETHDRITLCTYLNTGESVAVDVVCLNQTTTFAKDVYAALVTGVDLVLAANAMRTFFECQKKTFQYFIKWL